MKNWRNIAVCRLRGLALGFFERFERFERGTRIGTDIIGKQSGHATKKKYLMRRDYPAWSFASCAPAARQPRFVLPA